ncbi:MAG TPA: hypothetical protein VEA41_22625 [Salinarimonas sp.]|nr:hypothetical protein [Salinarimonas sp.]
MRIAYDDLWCCVDCTMYIANGDVPEDREDLPDLVAREWGDRAPFIVLTDGEEEFSRSGCDCCGSHLAGYRHEFVVLKCDNS